MVRLVLLAAAGVMVAGRLYQEWRRLAKIHKLPGAQALAYYQRTRRSADWALVGVTGLLAVSACAALVYAWLRASGKG
jgi:hypothetical protein